MKVKELIARNRSCRRFRQSEPVPMRILEELVDVARLCGSAENKQPLKYILSNDTATNSFIFKRLGWAGHLTDWPGPEEGERPAAYIIVLQDKTIDEEVECDHGIACQSMLLAAVEQGLAGCIIGTVARKKLASGLSIPGHLEVLLVLALGRPAETRVIEPMGEDRDIRYWRDGRGVHHVPKRSLAEIVVARHGA